MIAAVGTMDAVVGMALVTVTLGAIGWSGRRCRQALLGPVDPVLGWLVDGVLAVAGLLWLAQALGTVGRFDAPAVVVGALVLATVVRWRVPASTDGERDVGAQPPDPHPLAASGWPVLAAWGAVALLAARWVERLLQTFPAGIGHADVLHYHGPMAAIWAQTGDTWAISFWSVGDASAYHPGGAELLHAVGMLLMSTDVLSFLVNLPFVAMGVAAGWRVGLRRGNAPLGMVAVAAMFVLRFVSAEAGQILNDAIPLALLVVTVAFFDEARARARQEPWLALAGLAAGLAIGAKLTVVVPVLALVVLAWASARRRVRGTLLYVGGALLGGGYWYLRNLVVTGNPIPAFEHGPFPGPTFPELQRLEHSIFSYVGDVDVWRHYFVPGVRSALGPLFPVLPGVALLGAVAVLVERRRGGGRETALLAGVGLVSFLGYLANPSAAYGEDGDPWVFKANIRYAFPALLLCGLAVLAHQRVRQHPRGAMAVGLAVFGSCALYRPDVPRFLAGLAVVAVVVGGGWLLRALAGSRRRVAVGLLVVAGGLGAVAAQDVYLTRRWTADTRAEWRVYHAAQGLHGARFLVTGQPQTYPFYGEDLSNVVRYAGREADHVYVPLASCQEWWQLVDDVGADHVAVLSESHLAASDLGVSTVVRPTEWLGAAGATAIVEVADATLYSLEGAEPRCEAVGDG